MSIYNKISRSFPDLKLQLIQAGIGSKPEDFIKQTVMSGLMVAFAISFVFLLVFLTLGVNAGFIIFVFPVTFLAIFFFMVKGVKSKSNKIIREIDKEIIYAGRFILIELNAGVPLFDAMKNASFIYKGVGKPFRSIVDKVNIGKPLEQALAEVIEMTPSLNLRKLLWQIMNSLRTGGDICDALSAIINQLAKEQIIAVRAYSKKLNALVMFYLMAAIVAPSLGVTILSLISLFMKISLNLGNLLAVAFFVFLIQIMFLSIIRTSRPGVSI